MARKPNQAIVSVFFIYFVYPVPGGVRGMLSCEEGKLEANFKLVRSFLNKNKVRKPFLKAYIGFKIYLIDIINI